MLNSDHSVNVTPTEKARNDVITKKITAKDIEKWEVAYLSSNIEPRSKPSNIFEKLEEKKKLRHQKLLQELAKSLYEVNQSTEKNIKMSSLELKAHSKDFEDKFQTAIKNINTPEVATYRRSVFIQLQNTADEYKSQQQKLVNELYLDLLKFENERAKKNKKILQVACEEIRKVGYFLPYEVQTFVEHETLKMNKLSLNNRRCYEDLKLTLTLVTEQKFKSFMDRVYCIRETWAQNKLREDCYRYQNKVETAVHKIMPEAYVRLEMRDYELNLQRMPGTEYNTCTADEWDQNVTAILAILDAHTQHLINLSKKTIMIIYKGFEAEAEETKAELTSLSNLILEERTIKPIVFDVEEDQAKDLEEMEMHWQQTLEVVKKYSEDLIKFLIETGKLWERHMERMCESKKLILKALEKADSSNQAFLQDLEVKVNFGLDALRQEHNETKMEKAYEAVVILLDSIKEKYEAMYLEEVSTVEDFYEMVTLEADVLMADIEEFIFETHPVDMTKVIHRYSNQLRYIPEKNTILRDLHICSRKVQAFKLWKAGIWIALENLSGRTRESLKPIAENWIQKKIEDLAEKKNLQLELLSKRYQRIQVEICEKRLAEIYEHQDTFSKHHERVSFVLNQAREQFEKLVERESDEIQKIKDHLTEVEEKVLVEDRPGVICGNHLTIDREREETENKLKVTFERFRAECDTKMSDLQQANISKMKSIKLFHESGNYSSEEAKLFMAMLEDVEKEINTELKNIVRDAYKEEGEIIKKVTAMFSPTLALLSLLYEETLFHQEIQQRIRNFAQDIREEANILKSDFNFLNNQSTCLCKILKNPHEFDPDSEEKFWNFVTELLYRNVSRLIHPIGFPESIDSGTERSLMGECTAASVCCCAGKFSISPQPVVFRSPEKIFSCKDYRSELFNCSEPPENNGTFMSVMCCNFWNEMSFLQSAACDFYKRIQGRKIIRDDLISSNYDEFANEILTKFKYYHMQVQQFWLQIILDFLPLLGRIKASANYYMKMKVERYKTAAIRALEAFENNFRSCIENQNCENSMRLEDLDKKLLPLHGYPHNSDLLSALEEEVVRKTAEMDIQWESLIKNFKNEIKCFRVHHIQHKFEINKIENYLLKLQNTIFVDDLSENLLDALLNYCEDEKFCVKKISIENTTSENEPLNGEATSTIEVPDEHKLDITSKKNTETVQAYQQRLKEIIFRERSLEDEAPPCSTGSEASDMSFPTKDFCMGYSGSGLNILLKVIDLNHPFSEILESLNEYVRNLKTFAASQQEDHEAKLYNWLSSWKFNVKKVLKLYNVMYEEKETKMEENPPQPSENNKPQTEKTSASVTLTLPRLYPTTKLDLKDTSCNIPKLKSLTPRSRTIPNESENRPGVADHLNENLSKSKLTKLNNCNRVREFTSRALSLISPRNYHGQIPVLRRRSVNFVEMSPPDLRSPSPPKKKEKSSNKVKTITFEENSKKKHKTRCSRSPSPVKKASDINKKSKSRSSTSPVRGNSKNSEQVIALKRSDSSKPATSPRTSSPTKTKAKPKVMSSSNVSVLPAKNKSGKESKRQIADAGSNIIKQASQPSLSKSEKIIQPQEKISLDHIKNEVYPGDHRRLSLEKVHLCIEQNYNKSERKRSFFVAYSSEQLQDQKALPLSFLKKVSSTDFPLDVEKRILGEEAEETEAIRTLSGQELILTPSMKLEIEKEEADCLEISSLLNGTGENFEANKDIHIPQDDANEYDSELSTDGELGERETQPSREDGVYKNYQDSDSLWKSREADLLNDVDYRQSVYHPAVSRRQNSESEEMEFRARSKSIEDNFDFGNKGSRRIVRTHSSNLKSKYSSQCFADNMDAAINDRSWASCFDKTDEKSIYNSVFQDVPFYGMKRIRTKKERVSGAFLRFTLKIIRLLAIFNMWPGDNCYMLTSQLLRFSR